MNTQKRINAIDSAIDTAWEIRVVLDEATKKVRELAARIDRDTAACVSVNVLQNESNNVASGMQEYAASLRNATAGAATKLHELNVRGNVE